MNQVATINNNSLVPANMEQAMKLADMMSGAKLVPVHLQGKPADCLLVIEQAARWKMSPFAVAQCTSVIQGKLMYEGKLVAAVVNANGNLADRLSFSYTGEGDQRKIVVSGRFENEKEARTVDVMLKDVRTSNTMWQKQPDQQLMYSGTRAWARRHAPELMLGVYSPEEFNEGEMIDVTPAAKSIFKNAALRNTFVNNVIKSFDDAQSKEDLLQLATLNKDKMDAMKASGNEHDALAVDELRKRYNVARSRFTETEDNNIAASFGESFANTPTDEPPEQDEPPVVTPSFMRRKPQEGAAA